MKTIVQTKLEAFNTADGAWQLELEKEYGKRAGDARYNQRLNAATPPLARLKQLRSTMMAEYETALREYRLAGTPFDTPDEDYYLKRAEDCGMAVVNQLQKMRVRPERIAIDARIVAQHAFRARPDLRDVSTFGVSITPAGVI